MEISVRGLSRIFRPNAMTGLALRTLVWAVLVLAGRCATAQEGAPQTVWIVQYLDEQGGVFHREYFPSAAAARSAVDAMSQGYAKQGWVSPTSKIEAEVAGLDLAGGRDVAPVTIGEPARTANKERLSASDLRSKQLRHDGARLSAQRSQVQKEILTLGESINLARQNNLPSSTLEGQVAKLEQLAEQLDQQKAEVANRLKQFNASQTKAADGDVPAGSVLGLAERLRDDSGASGSKPARFDGVAKGSQPATRDMRKGSAVTGSGSGLATRPVSGESVEDDQVDRIGRNPDGSRRTNNDQGYHVTAFEKRNGNWVKVQTYSFGPGEYTQALAVLASYSGPDQKAEIVTIGGNRREETRTPSTSLPTNNTVGSTARTSSSSAKSSTPASNQVPSTKPAAPVSKAPAKPAPAPHAAPAPVLPAAPQPEGIAGTTWNGTDQNGARFTIQFHANGTATFLYGRRSFSLRWQVNDGATWIEHLTGGGWQKVSVAGSSMTTYSNGFQHWTLQKQ